MATAAYVEAIGRGASPFPLLRVDWAARGVNIGTERYSPAMRLVDGGQITATTRPGGWDEIVYGGGRGLSVVETAVSVSDADCRIIRAMESYDLRGSAAKIDFLTPGLVEADWEPGFRGVVKDCARETPYTKILLKTDDSVLRTPLPSLTFTRPEWPSASDTTIYGTAMPLLLGVLDSYAVTARGMVPAVNVRYDKDLGRWWLASIGNLVEIRRIYFDGVAQPSTIWTTLRGVWGMSRCTIIKINEGSQPEKGVVVSFDAEGPDLSGLETGTSMTNPVRQLRTVLEEYIYRKPPYGAYRGDHAIIDDTSWDYAETWFAARGYESANLFGADQNAETGAEVVDSFLASHQWADIFWNERGVLQFSILDPDDVDPVDASLFDIEKHHAGGLVAFAPGNNREVYNRFNMPFMWSPAERKYVSSLLAHDVATLYPEVVKLDVPNRWSQGRYTLE